MSDFDYSRVKYPKLLWSYEAAVRDIDERKPQRYSTKPGLPEGAKEGWTNISAVWMPNMASHADTSKFWVFDLEECSPAALRKEPAMDHELILRYLKSDWTYTEATADINQKRVHGYCTGSRISPLPTKVWVSAGTDPQNWVFRLTRTYSGLMAEQIQEAMDVLETNSTPAAKYHPGSGLIEAMFRPDTAFEEAFCTDNRTVLRFKGIPDLYLGDADAKKLGWALLTGNNKASPARELIPEHLQRAIEKGLIKGFEEYHAKKREK